MIPNYADQWGDEVGKYRKKPVVIDAVQWKGEWPLDGFPQWVRWAVTCGNPARLEIDTLEGPHLASPGDWLIRGVKDEVYPCKPDIFEATYERVPGDDT